jgi:hypothetical protein
LALAQNTVHAVVLAPADHTTVGLTTGYSCSRLQQQLHPESICCDSIAALQVAAFLGRRVEGKSMRALVTLLQGVFGPAAPKSVPFSYIKSLFTQTLLLNETK